MHHITIEEEMKPVLKESFADQIQLKLSIE